MIATGFGELVGVEDFTLYPATKPEASGKWRVVQQQMDAIGRAQAKRARLARDKQERRKR